MIDPPQPRQLTTNAWSFPKTDPLKQSDTFVDASFYIKLKETIEVILVLIWGVFIQQLEFNELDDRMSKLEKGQKFNKPVEETAVEPDGEMSMETELIRKFITQQVASAMAKKTKQY